MVMVQPGLSSSFIANCVEVLRLPACDNPYDVYAMFIKHYSIRHHLVNSQVAVVNKGQAIQLYPTNTHFPAGSGEQS